MHVTSIGGLKGILADGRIRPNRDGTRGYNSLGSEPNCYVCQQLGAVSVLDLKTANESELFDGAIQNWLGIFIDHRPAIALMLADEFVESKLVRGRDNPTLRKIIGRYV
jgi:hypothetical protein